MTHFFVIYVYSAISFILFMDLHSLDSHLPSDIQQTLANLPYIYADHFEGDDEEKLKKAFAKAKSLGGGQVVLGENKTYKLKQGIDLTHHGRMLSIIGNNSVLTTEKAGIGPLLKRTSTAKNASRDSNEVFKISQLNFRGNRLAGVDGLHIHASFGSIIEQCEFIRCEIGCDIAFGISTTLINCKGTQNSRDSFRVRSGAELWGGSTSFLASNAVLFLNCRVYSEEGAETAYRIINVSNTRFDGCIAEGNNPKWNWLFEGNSNTARSGYLINCWGENNPEKGSVGLYTNAGQYKITGFRTQSPGHKLVDASGASRYVTVVWEDMSYFPKQGKFIAKNTQEPKWVFRNFPTEDLLNPHLWDKGLIGDLVHIDSHGGSIYRNRLPFRRDGGRLGFVNTPHKSSFTKPDGSIGLSVGSMGIRNRVIQPGYINQGFVTLGDAPLISKNAMISIWANWQSGGESIGQLRHRSAFFTLKASEGAIKLVDDMLISAAGLLEYYTYRIGNFESLMGNFGHLAICIQSGKPKAFINGEEAEVRVVRGSNTIFPSNRLFYSDDGSHWASPSTFLSFMTFTGSSMENEVSTIYQKGLNYNPLESKKSSRYLSYFGLNKMDQLNFSNWEDESGNNHPVRLVNFRPPFELVPTLDGRLVLHGAQRFNGNIWKHTVDKDLSILFQSWTQGDEISLYLTMDGNHRIRFFHRVKSNVDFNSLKSGETILLKIFYDGDLWWVREESKWKS